MVHGSPPILLVRGKSITEVWEKSILKTWKEGVDVRTEYDSPGDPPSKDSTMIMIVEEPMAEPRIHLSMPGGLVDLGKYVVEVVEGVRDHWVEEGVLPYTYHERLFNYGGRDDGIDQVAYIIEKLSETPYSRRAQAITWNPRSDPWSDSPPCLQRIWCRCFRDEKDGKLYLNLNLHWRSRDAYKAAFMNMFALTELQRLIAEGISEKRGEEVRVGRYLDISDSYHIYGRDLEELEMRLIKNIERRAFYDGENPLNSRTMRSDNPQVLRAFEEARRMYMEEKRMGDRGLFHQKPLR